MLKENLLKALSKKGEREATKFLKANPQIVLWSFCWTGGHSKYVLNEFPLGSKYRADFVVLLSYSFGWEITFIELENTDDIVVTKAGRPSKRLNSAISQIHDWNDYIKNNRASVQKDLSDWCMKKDLLGWHTKDGLPSNYTADYLHDPNIHIKLRYST
jgi:hypothetical protein